MVAFGLAVRWLYLSGLVLLVGAATTILLAGHGERPTALRWEARVLALSRAVAVLTLVTGVAVLAALTASFEGRPAAALEPAALARVVLDTQSGHVWAARQGVLLLLAAFLALRWDVARRIDWRAVRGEAALLGAAALVLLGASGHAAAVEPGTARALTVDGLHLLAAGVWAGGLLPLLLLLRAAAREAGADARPYAVLAARRFSRAALVAMLVLTVSGALNAWTQVGSVAGLVGTAYGRWLLLKLALLLPILGLAAINRRRHLPRLGGDAAAVGRPAARGLARFVGGEAALAAALLGVVAVMSATPPAAHEAPDWPFAFRLTTVVVETDAALRLRALVGSQVAVLGVVGLLASAALRTRRLAVGGGALGLLAVGLGLALPPLAVDAYPTTYRRPAVSYQAASIATGVALFRANCVACHGVGGAGDGPAGRGLPRPPADLRAPHTAQHTAGDLFWWLTHGIPRAGMPPFGGRLSEEQRWDLINFLRALSAGYAARGLGPVVAPERAWLVAPDFSFAVGPTPARALKDYRGRRVVLLVLYTLPASRPRLDLLARRYDLLAALGVEVIAVPVDAAPDALRQLGAAPPVLFPVVTDGAAEIAAAYRLFANAPHTELLIDRQGYIRSIARGHGEAGGLGPLRAEIEQLNAEKALVEAPEEHVH